MTLTPEDRAALATEIAEHVFAMQVQPVWTTEMAMQVTGKKSARAFHSWVARYAPRSGCGNGRYSRAKIMQGMNREEKTGRQRRSGQHLNKGNK